MERTLSYSNESQFYTDRWAFLAAIEAFKIRRKNGKPQNGSFQMPSPWQSFLFNYQGVDYPGQGIGFGKDGSSQIRHTSYGFYRFESANSCRLETVHPAFP